MAPGSRKNLGFFSIPTDSSPQDRHVILCESAIDAISAFALHPGHRCISTSGARPNPAWLGTLINQGAQVYCGFDADQTGQAMAQAMIAFHPSIIPLPPPHHDWNDLLKSRA
jgi:DNA primase